MKKDGTLCGDAAVDVQSKRPEFQAIVSSFAELIETQHLLSEKGQWEIPAFVPVVENDFLSGTALVLLQPKELFSEGFCAASKALWPRMAEIFPTLETALRAFLEQAERVDWMENVLAGMAQGDEATFSAAAAFARQSPGELYLAAMASWSVVMMSFRPALLATAPTELWRKSFCPVCGSDPDVGSLEVHADSSDFLISKSGEIWHHCPVCAHRWRFVRMVCPGCGNLDHKTLGRFFLPESPEELVYTCDQCSQYLPCLDLTEKTEMPEYRYTALKLLHLDAIAQSKGYSPVSPAPWTVLHFEANVQEPS